MEASAAKSGPLERWVWPNVPKSHWGRRGWNWAHLVAIDYPQTPSRADAQRARARIWNFVSHLPCDDCRRHAMAYVRRHPPVLTDTYAFQAWVWRFHNAVNARLGKPVVPYDKYLEIFADEICLAHWKAGCMLARQGRPK